MATPARRTDRVVKVRVTLGWVWCVATLLGIGVAGMKAAPERLYVVTSDYATQTGRVLVVDPGGGQVVARFTKGYRPDVLPSLDGTRLFVTYDRRLAPGGVFEVLDASTGAVLFRREEDYRRGGMPGGYDSRMALSRDGAWLFRYKRTLSEKTGPSEWLETFDTAQNAMLPDTAPLPLCGETMLLPSNRREVLFVVCPGSHDLRVVTLTGSGAAADRRPPRLNLGGGARLGVVMPAFLGDAGQLTVIKTNGSFVRFDTASRRVSEEDTIDRAARRATIPDERPEFGRRKEPPSPTDWLADRAISHRGVLSPDGSKLYAIASGKPPSIPAEIVVLDARTFERIRAIPLRRGVSSFTISVDGAQLYAIDVPNAAIVVIDAASGAELKVISNVGPGPVFVVVGS